MKVISIPLIAYCIAMMILIASPSSARADEIEDFAAAVNAAWSKTNDSQIVVLINQRLNQDTNDVAALSVKMYYHLWVDGNLTNAQAVASQIDLLAQSSTNQAAQSFFTDMKAEVDGIPLTESGPFTQAALDQFRQETKGIFPSIRRCVWLAKTLFDP